MNNSPLVAFVALLGFAVPAQAQTAAGASMFDGKSLNGWDGNPAVWRVVERSEERRVGKECA